MVGHQTTLFGKKNYLNKRFPSTRYQGSKAKIIDWVWSNLAKEKFDSILDAFGGTGIVSFEAKKHNKSVTFNDKLKFSYQVGLALIENNLTRLKNSEINWIISSHSTIEYPSFIQDTFKDIYFTDKENKWLDMVVTNILGEGPGVRYTNKPWRILPCFKHVLSNAPIIFSIGKGIDGIARQI